MSSHCPMRTGETMIRVVCFGLQGFGNDLLYTLSLLKGVEVRAIYTRNTPYEFGYYECSSIASSAKKLEIPYYFVDDSGDWSCEAGDLAIVSSFHRIFNPAHIGKFTKVINIHPSLLPAYRGQTPTNWAARNGERIIGLTAHGVVDTDIDSGPVYFRRRLLNPYLTDGEMRKSLSFLSRELIRDIIRQFPDYTELAKEGKSEYFPGRTIEDAIVDVADFCSINDLIHFIKAFTNYPMPHLKIDGRVFVVDYQYPETSVCVNILGDSFSVLGHWVDEFVT